MVYYKKKQYELLGFQKSNRKGKMYDAIIQNILTKKSINVPFGSVSYQNYQDKTGLNLYPELIHGDKKRKILYKARHKHNVRSGYFSPGYFSYKYLW
tara:strand:- start:1448 stop:1738 length:291 start_codon:yes stop_codon:yes gene_type:complete